MFDYLESPRLFTTHGTVLYVDTISGLLVHGPTFDSPANARLTTMPTGYEVRETVSQHLPVSCTSNRCGITPETQHGGTTFLLTPLGKGWVALEANGFFLSAVPGGAITISATVCQAWESFYLADPRPKNLNHTQGSEILPPTIGISCVETRDHRGAIRAIESTCAAINVDCLYWFSDEAYSGKLSNVEIVNIRINRIKDFKSEINTIYLRLMPKVVTSDFNIIVQADGFAVNPQAWDDDFFNYDYIGGPWTWMGGGGPYWPHPIVGNGGFSLRSRRLYQALKEMRFDWSIESRMFDPRLKICDYYAIGNDGKIWIPEDLLISLWYRDELERSFGIKFCSPELACKFSVESISSFTTPWLGKSFGFHGLMAAPHYNVVL